MMALKAKRSPAEGEFLFEIDEQPEENAPPGALARVNEDLVRELARRCPEQKIATIDLDATMIESWKQQAKPTHEGSRGYQPHVALWAEMGVVADEFNDGNVPALKDPLRVAQRAFAALPASIQQRYFRRDSACDEEALLSWLRNPQREGGPEGFVGFAVSARMKRALWAEIAATPEENRQPCRRFGANAAWFRLAVISYNLLVAMKRLALPPELLAAQPERLRSVVFDLPRRLIWHACRLVLRMVCSCNRFSNWRHAWGQLPLPSPG